MSFQVPKDTALLCASVIFNINLSALFFCDQTLQDLFPSFHRHSIRIFPSSTSHNYSACICRYNTFPFFSLNILHYQSALPSALQTFHTCSTFSACNHQGPQPATRRIQLRRLLHQRPLPMIKVPHNPPSPPSVDLSH